jgi:hypothetical protein
MIREGAVAVRLRKESTMLRRQGQQPLRWWVLGSIALAAVVLVALLARQAVAQGGTIVLDGVGDDWDPSWQVSTDGLDVFLTNTADHPHESPTYARSGYDATGLWAHFQPADARWYFRIDVDGRVGDSDSAVGSPPPGDLGFGTHDSDYGPLCEPPGVDGVGLSLSEVYLLGLRFGCCGKGGTARFGDDSSILPGVVAPTAQEGLHGWGVYSTTVAPGVLEFGFDRAALFPDGRFYDQLWVSAQLGDSEDRVSDDQVAETLVTAQDLGAQCPQAPAVIGSEATFPLDFSVPQAAQQGITDVILTARVPAGTEFISANHGGTESNGVITWSLEDLAPGDAGTVQFTVRLDNPADPMIINSEMSCAEGLRSQVAKECPYGETPVVPEPATVTLMLTGMGGLAGYAVWQWRARRRE